MWLPPLLRQLLGRTAPRQDFRRAPPQRAVFEEVEARLLYSADFAPGLSDTITASEIRVLEPESGSTDNLTRPDIASSASGQSQVLIFIDTSVNDVDELARGILEQNPHAEIILLNTEQDGIDQISRALEGRDNISALHIISHGAAGMLQIGNSQLDADTLAGHASRISAWQSALTADADLMLYGCNLAADSSGRELVDQLARLTGADVAASTDLTGTAELGGDWALEYQQGRIETTPALETSSQSLWVGSLAVRVDSSTTNATNYQGATTSAGATSLTIPNYTVGSGSNGLLIVEYSTRGTTSPASITYGGVALTRLDTHADAGGTVTTEIWYLKTPAAGTANVVITMPGAAKEFSVGVSNYFNVDQTTPFGTVFKASGTSGTAVSNVVTDSAVGEIVIDSLATHQQGAASILVGSGQTETWNAPVLNLVSGQNGSADPWGAGSREAGAAGNVTMSWTLGASSSWASLAVSLNSAPNTAPTIAITPSSYSATEQVPIYLHGTGSNAITVADSDGDTLTLTISSGGNSEYSAVAGTTGVSIISGNGTSSLVLRGTSAQLNNLLAGNQSGTLTFRMAGDTPVGSVTMTMSVSDGIASASDTATINITAVNDPPVITAPASITVTEDVASALTGFSVSDADSASGNLVMTLTVGSGSLSATSGGSVTVGGTSTARTLTGTAANINAFISAGSLTYTTASNSTTAVTLTVNINDQGNSGSGGAQSDAQDITLNVTAVNDAPTITSNGGGTSSSINVTENTTAVTTVTASDVDAGSTLTYSISGGADAAKFSINSSTGVLTFVSAPDYENPTDSGANNVYDVIVRVSDGSLADTQTLAITVTNANEAPSISSNGGGSSASISVTENTTTVTTATSTDPDAGATRTWSIAGGADAGKFSINSSTGVLSFVTAPNFESPTDSGGNNVYDVIVQVSDGSLTDTQTLAVTVTDINEAPILTSNGGGASAAISLAENTSTVTTVTSTDPDAGATRTYSIAGGGDSSLFSINSSTGVLSFITPPNFEAPTDDNTNNIYNVIVQVSDGSLTDTQTLVITITDTNEAPTITSNSGGASASISVAENVTTVTTVTASDVDAGSNLVYSITGGADSALFSINSSTGVLTFISAPNFESPADAGGNNVYDVIVQVSDGSLTDTQTLAVTVTAVNDNTPSITSNGGGATALISIAENTTAVTTVTATDADLPAQTLTYSISGGTDAAFFTINSSTGVLSFSTARNYESAADANANNVYQVIVQVSDGTNIDTQSISVTITDVDEFDVGAVTDSNASANSVAENAANGSSVGITASATDADGSNNTITYSLSNSAGGRFAINSSTGVVTVADGTLLNYESATSHGITVLATSADGSTSSQSFTINLTDVDEFDVGSITDSNASANSVSENAANGSTVGLTASASDADATNNTITYSLSDSAGGRFAINGSTGVVTVADGSLLNYESATSHSITVLATSADGSTRTQSFTINLTDVDEFDVGSITDSNASTNSVSENAANGSTVGLTAQASDADATNNTITYSLSDSAGGRFAINATTGVVTVANGSLLNYETATSHSITVLATSIDGSSSSQSFTINLLDVDEFNVGPVTDINASANSLAENAANGSSVGITASASDADGSNNAITYSLSDTAGGRFAIDGSTGVITVANSSLLNFEAATSHSITVLATSADGSTSSQSFTINLTDVDEFDVGAIFDSNVATNEINEHTSNGTEVGITASATDADATTNTITYSLDDDSSGRFTIDSSTGVVTVANAAAIDYIEATGGVQTYSITVRATSSDTSYSTASYSINIIDQNDSFIGAISDTNTSANTVAENSLGGTLVGITASASDPDNAPIVYSLDNSAGGRFSIDSSTGVVTVASMATLDRETAASYTITVRATSPDTSFSTRNFTISLIDVDEVDVGAVTDSNGSANTIGENATNGSTVGITALATDADATTNTITYTLSDSAGGRFAIHSSTGVVTVADGSLIDYETATSHSITVLATSADGSSSSQSFTINVTNVNDNPPVITSNGGASSANLSQAENTTSVTTVTATDADAGSTLTYSIIGGADAAKFTIDTNTGALSFLAAPDREAASDADLDHIYEVTVQVTDGSSTDSQLLSITITDVDESDVGAISDANASANTIAENTADGSIVGITATATDNDATTNAITYTLSDSAGGRFAIHSSTGVVTVSDGSLIDYESATSHNITVLATSADGSTSSQSFTINVTNLNDNAPVITSNGGSSSASLSLAENTTTATTVTASDADAGSTLTYSIVGGADSALFAIDANTGALSFLAAPNREAASDADSNHVYEVTVQVSDGSRTDTQAISITVTDVDEFDVGTITDVNASSNSISESVSNGSSIGLTANASDADATTNTVTYSLSNSAGGIFSIDSSTGVVRVANNSLIDYETATSHSITVLATSADGSTSSQNFTINITDINEFSISAVSDSNAAANNVDENAANGTSVGLTALATDADGSNNTVSYTLSDSANGRFAIDASTGIVTVADSSQLVYESATSHTITVLATSSDGSTSSQSFTITLNDINEFAVGPVSDINPGSNTVAENASTGSTVGITARATDADGTNNTITYTLSDDAGGRFTIHASTGVVTVANGSLLDYETATSHSITVLATSADTSTSSQSFIIQLTDANEFPVGAITDANASANTIAENAGNGDLVGITASASDADASTNTISYALSDDAGGRFAINSSTGVVTVANAGLLDYESATSHSITVLATSDDGSTASQSFTINLTDANEFSVGAISDTNSTANSVSESAANGSIVGITAQAIDADGSNNSISYALSDDAGGRFTIHATTGVVTVANNGLLDYETQTSHVITITATSSDGSSSNQSFLILISDANDNTPVITSDGGGATAGRTMPENSTLATIVTASDNDASSSLTYSLIGGADMALFSINASTGALSFLVAPDAETPGDAGGNNIYDVIVQVSDGLNTDSQAIAIQITDVNEFSVGPITDLDSTSNLISEGAASGSYVGIAAFASDADASNNSITYSLSDDAGGRFTINNVGGVGYIEVGNAGLLDYETATSHSITVLATSADGSTRSQTFTINIGDNNEFALGPVSDANTNSNSVAENAATGTLTGITAHAIDADGSTNAVSYSLSNNAGGRFAIHSTTGVVTVADGSLLNFEGTTSHSITVLATSADGSTSSQSFIINLTDVDEFDISAVTDSDAAINSLAENAGNGSLVGITATAADADGSNNTISYSLSDSAGGRFTIHSSTGIVTVADSSLIDYESATSHNITVLATSADGSASSQSFTINLTDLDEFDTSIITDSDPADNSVAENASDGSLVGFTANATDADGSNNSITYALSDDAGGRFTIHASTGVVTVANASLLDYETATSHSITILATSADGSTSSQSFIINLTDVDEFDISAVTDSDAAINSLAENASNGSLVGITANAADADGSNNSISYSLSDSAGGRFTIDAATGVVTVANGSLLDFETSASHGITILASSSDGSVSARSFTISLLNVNEAPGIRTPGDISTPDSTVSIVGITLNDPESNVTSVSLAVGQGSLSVSLVGNTIISAGANGSSQLSLSGNQNDLNSTLASLRYQGRTGFVGTDRIELIATDADGLTATNSLQLQLISISTDPEPPVLPIDPPKRPDPPPPEEDSADSLEDGAGDLIALPEPVPQAPEAEQALQFQWTLYQTGHTPPVHLAASSNNPTLESGGAGPNTAVALRMQQRLNIADGGHNASMVSETLVVAFAPAQDDGLDSLLRLSPTEAGQAAAAAFTAGVVWWASRATGLAAALLSSVPAWRTVDPLPILSRDRKQTPFETDDDDPVSTTLGSKPEALATSRDGEPLLMMDISD